MDKEVKYIKLLIVESKTIDFSFVAGMIQLIQHAGVSKLAFMQPIVLDLNKLSIVHSSAVGLLFDTHSRCKKYGVEIVICNLSPELKNVFPPDIYDSIIPYYNTREEAVQCFKKKYKIDSIRKFYITQSCEFIPDTEYKRESNE